MYDGRCAFCRACADLVRGWDREGRVDVFPYQDRARLAPTGVPPEQARRALYLVAPDGRRWRGAEAVARLLRLLPGGSALGAVLELPGLRRTAERAYRWVAEHRGLVGRLTGLTRPPRRSHEA